MKAVLQWVLRTMMKDQTGIVRTMPKKDLVDFNVAMTMERLMRNGIDPNSLKNANQVENAINQIEAPRNVQQGIKSAKVFDMEGKEIKNPKNIMGGKEVKETEAEMAARMKEENKEAIKRFKQKMEEDKDFSILDPEDMAQGGRAGFDNGGAPSIKLFPRAKGMETEQRLGPRGDSPNLKLRELDYGITGLIKGDKFFGGAEIDKGKVKIDVTTPGGDTIFKDTISKKDAVNFILGMGDPQGDKFQIKTDKDLENMQLILKKSFADGGRASFDEGGMTRRTFLKILGGLASIPIVGKILKPVKIGKTVSKVPVIKTAPVAGKPEWFDSLVNKVIVEGDDVTKRFATGERQTIHQKTLDDGSVVRVTEDTDQGAVRVEYESSENVFGDPVQMEYKRPLPDEATSNPRAEFTTAESGPVGRQSGPEDYEIEIDEVGGSSIRDLDSDVSKLKEYATGKKPTIKEMMQNKRRKDKARAISEESDAQTEAVIRRQGDYVDDDFSPDFASGGIAAMLGE